MNQWNVINQLCNFRTYIYFYDISCYGRWSSVFAKKVIIVVGLRFRSGFSFSEGVFSFVQGLRFRKESSVSYGVFGLWAFVFGVFVFDTTPSTHPYTHFHFPSNGAS